MDWTIRKAEQKDRDAILQLLKESFSSYWTASQSIYSQEFWNWLYRDNTGGGSLTFIAESNGKIIGHYPNVLMNLKVDKDLYMAGVILHLTTHSNFRKKGIFKNLGRMSLDELTRSRIPFSIAFPNDKSRPGFINKLGFSSIVTLPLLIKPLRIKNILNRMIKIPLLSLVFSFILGPIYYIFSYRYKFLRNANQPKIETREDFGPEFDSLWNRAMSQTKVVVPRDSRFLNWRFIQRPNQRYEIFVALRDNELAGYIVTRNARIFSLDVGIIMDYFSLSDKNETFDFLMDKVIEYFKKQEMDLCIVACLKHNIYYPIFKKQGFIRVPSRFNPRKLVLVGRINHDDIYKDIFLDDKSWFLNFSDWDIF